MSRDISKSKKVAFWGEFRGAGAKGFKTISSTLDVIGTTMNGLSTSIEDLTEVGNLATLDMVNEARFSHKKNALILEAKETALTTTLADEEFKKKMAESAKQSILEDLEF